MSLAQRQTSFSGIDREVKKQAMEGGQDEDSTYEAMEATQALNMERCIEGSHPGF
jgi:hypothetical protein